VAIDSHGSITHWIAELKTGDADVAQQEIWGRYFRRLTSLAKLKLGDAPRSAEDEEDVALSALGSFFFGFAEDRFPQLADRHNLWSLLAKITACKAINQRKRQLAYKRGGGAVQSEATVAGDDDMQRTAQLVELVADDLTPEFIAAINEECQLLMNGLPDEQFRRIARMKLEGYTNTEIAADLGVVERTIERKLGIIRGIWLPDDKS
jgi:DNA-directed RNA polymerase specialized sigma24 family protein